MHERGLDGVHDCMFYMRPRNEKILTLPRSFRRRMKHIDMSLMFFVSPDSTIHFNWSKLVAFDLKTPRGFENSMQFQFWPCLISSRNRIQPIHLF